MTKQELVDNIREMVIYILPKKHKKNKGIIDSFTNTFVSICEDYSKNK